MPGGLVGLFGHDDTVDKERNEPLFEVRESEDLVKVSVPVDSAAVDCVAPPGWFPKIKLE